MVFPTELCISFSYKHGCIRVYKTVIEALENPKYVFFTLSERNKILMIIGTDERNNECLPVEKYIESGKTGSLKFSGKAFVRKIGSCVGWELGETYTAFGNTDATNRVVVFDLAKAVPGEAGENQLQSSG